MKNFYEILELQFDASQEKIKEQYRFIVNAWHPDKFSSPAHKAKAEEKIKEINEAYQILNDPSSRAQYDRELSAKSQFKQEESRQQRTHAENESQRRKQTEQEQRRTEYEHQQREQAEKARSTEEYEHQQRKRSDETSRDRKHLKVIIVGGVVIVALAVYILVGSIYNAKLAPSMQTIQVTEIVKSSSTQYIEQPLNPPALPTDIPTLSTDILAPTNIPLPIPTGTIPPDTQPNTILEVGETWYQEGVAATLVSANLKDLDLHFELVNHTPYQLTGEIEVPRNINLIANTSGVEFQPSGCYTNMTYILDAGQSMEYSCTYSTYFGSLGDPSVTELFVVVNISRITNAKWRIPIFH